MFILTHHIAVAAWGLTDEANRRRADGAQRRRRGVRVEREIRRRTGVE